MSAMGESFTMSAGAFRSSSGARTPMSGEQSPSLKSLRPEPLRRAGSA